MPQGTGRLPIGTAPRAIGFCYKDRANPRPSPCSAARDRLPSLQQLRVFEAVADVESISAAARTIHLSQPSVTQALGHLEAKVGAPLFDRRRTGCYLTPAGRIFLARATRMSEQIRQALCEPVVGPSFADRSGVAPHRAQDHRRAGAKPDRHFGERLVRRGGAPHRHHRAVAAPLGAGRSSAFCGARSTGAPRRATPPRRRPRSWRAASRWPRARSNTAWTRSPPSAATSRRASSSATSRTPTCTCSRPPSTSCWRNSRMHRWRCSTATMTTC